MKHQVLTSVLFCTMLASCTYYNQRLAPVEQRATAQVNGMPWHATASTRVAPTGDIVSFWFEYTQSYRDPGPVYLMRFQNIPLLEGRHEIAPESVTQSWPDAPSAVQDIFDYDVIWVSHVVAEFGSSFIEISGIDHDANQIEGTFALALVSKYPIAGQTDTLIFEGGEFSAMLN